MYGVLPALMTAFIYSDHGGQKRVLDSLELELPMVVSGRVGDGGLVLEEQPEFFTVEPSLQPPE